MNLIHGGNIWSTFLSNYCTDYTAKMLEMKHIVIMVDRI